MIERILAKRIAPVVVVDRAESIRRIASRLPEILLGAGTLLEKEQVQRAKDTGARFGLVPGLNPNIGAHASELGLQFSPRVTTPNDIEHALALGCKLLKLFPAESAGGANMLKALAGPYAHTGVKFIPTGGITSGNLASYLKLAIVAAIGGLWMVDKQLGVEGKWSEITRITREALSSAAEA